MQTIIKIINSWPVRWAVTLLWTAVLVIILVQPENQPIINTGVQPAPPTLEREIAFTSLHVVSFFITTSLWIWTLTGFPHSDAPHQGKLWVAVSIALSIGFVTEGLQSNVPGRALQLTDFIANGCGVAFALGVTHWLRK